MTMRSALRAVSRRLEVHCLIPQCPSSWRFSFDQDPRELASDLTAKGWTYETDQPTRLGLAHGWMCPAAERHEDIQIDYREVAHG